LSLVAAFALLTRGPASAEDTYPNKRIELLIPYGAGAATDTFARIIADGLSQKLGQPLVAINKPGANGTIAVRAAQAADSNGYTLLILANGIVIEQVLKKDVKFDIRTDLIPVARAVQAPLGMFVSNHLAVNSVKELIDYAKANPGKVNFASAG